MADLPIPFSAPMVRAILREIEQPGTGKMQTRRVLTRLRRFGKVREFGPSDTQGYDWHFRDKAGRWHDLRHAALLKALPFVVGDRVYLREAWRTGLAYEDLSPSELGGDEQVLFEANGATERWTRGSSEPGRLRQAMHMPRWASRITLIVTDVRVQRLQEISEADAIAEGLHPCGYCNVTKLPMWGVGGAQYGSSQLAAFSLLWDGINARRGYGWDANPWVAVYTFRPILGNIDQVRP